MAVVSNRRWLVGIAGGVALTMTASTMPTAIAAMSAEERPETQAQLDRYQSIAGPGAAVYAGNSETAWTLSAGSASTRERRPITSTDHFPIASQTKTFTAAVVLQLADEDLIALDTPIERYLPGVVTGNYDGTVITVRQLLQHTSGMVENVSDAKPRPDGGYELAELVRSAMDEPAQAAPGEDVKYSNVAYLVLGMLIEEKTGKTVGEAITERIIEPLGLDGTSFPAHGERALAEPFVPGYLGGRLPPFFFWRDNTTAVELSMWSTAGALRSTLHDSATFFRALLDGEVISAGALAEMRTFIPAGQGGAGLGIDEIPLSCGGTALTKNGNLNTGHTSMTAVTDDGRFASVVTNTLANTPQQGTQLLAVLDSALCE
ncbi:serine hydrolase [Prauserella marina]|uniref:D-alanyl-D-alanine carboxypeptidase n=1 Tax=Prauserella marina TaxID=530584 RepID=A0A222VTG7_9PSEU|nr:serine hydrolase domain-containing protein [Prauserella marina]ASR37227.1 serine hydrolase [Prauserella marina]PWV72548.1 D-alanyl-D-alanine carboxypeptidase [Prauserella marina]SDD77468.1 D-alanyl-D-alanine carboxypeptidase [Prauserella marina]